LVDIWENDGEIILNERQIIADDCLNKIFADNKFNEYVADHRLYTNLWTIYLPKKLSKKFLQ
jgi:hypothetical protein